MPITKEITSNGIDILSKIVNDITRITINRYIKNLNITKQKIMETKKDIKLNTLLNFLYSIVLFPLKIYQYNTILITIYTISFVITFI